MELTQQQLADAFRVSVRTIQRWEKDGLGRARLGDAATYDLAEAVAWRLERDEGSGDAGFQEAKARRMAAEASLKELTLGKERGELIHLNDVEALLRRPLERVSVELKNAPSRLAPKLSKRAGISHADALGLAKELVEEARTALREIPESVQA